jgi:methylated-DNA-[protein]-cysteine S-methyltransferase
MRLLLDRINTPVAPLLLVTDETGTLRALDFADHEARMLRLLGQHYGQFELIDARLPKSIQQSLSAYFDGDMGAFADTPIATNGTPFRQQVWAGLRTIPAGTTFTYGQLARQIGHPSASRAVGAANGSNPIAIVVPCHRVIGSSGSLTGFAGGIARKQWLLDHERRHTSPSTTATSDRELLFR